MPRIFSKETLRYLSRISSKVGTAILAAVATFFLHTTPVHGNEGAWQPAAPNSTYIKKVETTPWYLLAGENNAKIWEAPFNGIYYSVDLGKTWEQLALNDRGVTDLKYHNQNIYATTYFTVDNLNGLFISNDKGKTFYQSGVSKTATNVEVTDYAIYVGTPNHGLWVSKDNGVNWERKIGIDTNYPGLKIIGLVASNDVVISITPEKAYRSENNGDSWETVSSISGKQLGYLYINNNEILAGSVNTDGMYISKDLGKSWTKLISWGDYPTGSIYYLGGYFYASKKNSTTNKYEILKSNDLGETWINTGFDSPATQSNITSFTSIRADKTYLFAATPSTGIYKVDIDYKQPELLQFLNIPWQYTNANELVDKITSFFDHEYPLLGYNYFLEPSDKANTVTNFYGISGKPPDYYYSAHNGMDFKLDYGTDVLAPAPGLARYYFCADCGHSIKIDHQNGYESVFMHLQSDGLISTNANNKVWVNTGDKIGKVGMTGRTSGPHIHFGISTSRPYPSGLVDPFGWLDVTKIDPWETFEWTDGLGQHTGSKSKYLWNTLIPTIAKYITQEAQKTALDNISVEFDIQKEDSKITAVIKRYISPFIPKIQNNLKYVPLTSVVIEVFDSFGNGVSEVGREANIVIFLDSLDLTGIIKESLKIYFWDELEQIWKPLPTVLDLVDNILTGYTSHFSQFAVFGEKQYPDPPQTTLLIEGQTENNWYIEYPLVSFNTGGYTDAKATYFSVNKGVDWQVYAQPFVLAKDGLINILYRTEDTFGNFEPVQNYMAKIDTKGIWKSSAKVVSAAFQTN